MYGIKLINLPNNRMPEHIIAFSLLFFFLVPAFAETANANSSRPDTFIEVAPSIRTDTTSQRTRSRQTAPILSVNPVLRGPAIDTVPPHSTPVRETAIRSAISDTKPAVPEEKINAITTPTPRIRIESPKSESDTSSYLRTAVMVEVPEIKTPSVMILRFELETTTVQSDVPFPIRLRVLDENGFPAAEYSEPIWYESLFGVIPVVSSSKWQSGMFEDTVLIRRPGKNVMLIATSGRASGSIVLEVKPPQPDSSTWLALAETKLTEGKFDDAVYYFKLASSLTPQGDPQIEERLAKLYLSRGEWNKAQEHYQKALRAIAGSK